MTYVPDATVYTIEVIKGSGMQRMVENFRRWSGNMLRNGSRAMALGPRAMPPFIWWCLIDQRIAIWTMMVSPVLAIMGTILVPGYIVNAIIWVVGTRLILSGFLWRYASEPELSWTVILYMNQIVNAVVKIYMIFHLAKQKWFNRGNQATGGSGGIKYKETIAMFQMVTSVAFFVTFLAIYAGVLPRPF
jgi:glycosyltransferase Alg8